MKRIALLLLVLLFVISLSSCELKEVNDDKKSVVCLGFAEYDWTRNIVGESEGVAVSLLRDSGVDIHSYQPTAADLMDVSSAELLIYVASPTFAGFDDDIADMATSTLDLLEYSGVGEHDHSQRHDHDHTEDEHIWLSLSHAVECCMIISEKLSELDPKNAEIYEVNAKEYIKELTLLDAEYREAVSLSKNKTLVFVDRYPFAHMAHDYSLECHAAFSGCTGESEASFETIAHLITAVDENGLDCVITVDGSDEKIARAVISSTKTKDQHILTLDSMQVLGREDIENGVTYIAVMRDNLEVLRQALG